MIETNENGWVPDFSEASWKAAQAEVDASSKRGVAIDPRSFNLGRARMYADLCSQLPFLLPNIALHFLKRYGKVEIAERAFKSALEFAEFVIAREAWLTESGGKLSKMYGKNKTFWSRAVNKENTSAKSWGNMVRELQKKRSAEEEPMVREAEATQAGMRIGTSWEMIQREWHEKDAAALDIEGANSIKDREGEGEAVKYLKALGYGDKFIQRWRK